MGKLNLNIRCFVKLLISCLVLLSTQNTFSEVYKCTQKNNVVYQDKPCVNKLLTPNQFQAPLTDTQKYQQWKAKREPQIDMSGDQVIKNNQLRSAN